MDNAVMASCIIGPNRKGSPVRAHVPAPSGEGLEPTPDSKVRRRRKKREHGGMAPNAESMPVQSGVNSSYFATREETRSFPAAPADAGRQRLSSR